MTEDHDHSGWPAEVAPQILEEIRPELERMRAALALALARAAPHHAGPFIRRAQRAIAATDLVDLYRECRRLVSAPPPGEWPVCPDCQGAGTSDDADTPCVRCEGTGYIIPGLE
jgi:hypothetical protein